MTMSADIWFKEDIRNILISTNASSAATALCMPSPAVQIYRRGYEAAVMAIALACGILPEQIAFWPGAASGEQPVCMDPP
jgi:hypothetical protein